MKENIVSVLSGQNRKVTRDDILRFADQGDIRNAASILGEISDAVGSFQTIASDIGINDTVCSLIQAHIDSHRLPDEPPGRYQRT